MMRALPLAILAPLTAHAATVDAYWVMTPGTRYVADLQNADVTISPDGSFFVDWAATITPQVEKAWFEVLEADGTVLHYDAFVNVRPDGICRAGVSEGAFGRSGKGRLIYDGSCAETGPQVPLPAGVWLLLGALGASLWVHMSQKRRNDNT